MLQPRYPHPALKVRRSLGPQAKTKLTVARFLEHSTVAGARQGTPRATERAQRD